MKPYIVLVSVNERVDSLIEQVNEKIKEGYLPQGGVSMTHIGGRGWWESRPMQAMTFYKEK